MGLARASLLRGDVAAAEPLAERAVSLRAAALGESHPLTVEAHALHGQCGVAGDPAATMP
jgi:hypothetical protein